jgi:C1A family cysteine protease
MTAEQISKFKFGCSKDKEDSRDLKFIPKASAVTPQPIDLRPQCPPVRNQGSLGSCTAFATTAMVNFVRMKQKLSGLLPACLFTYYATRKIQNTIAEDSGATSRDALKSTVANGIAPEETWPYVEAKFAENPPKNVWDEAEKHQTLSYKSLTNTKEDILSCLSEGYPFTFGMYAYDSFVGFYTALTGDVMMPAEGEQIVGGHCMVAVGWYEQDEQSGAIKIIVQNSWGNEWGDKGYCHIPLDFFLTENVFDLWTMRSSELDKPTPFWKTKTFWGIFGVAAVLIAEIVAKILK